MQEQQSAHDYSPAKKHRRAPVTKEEYEASMEKQRAESRKNKHFLVGEWKSKKGDIARFETDGIRSAGGSMYLKGLKGMYWEALGEKISFYQSLVAGKSELVKGMGAKYNKKED